MDAARLRIFATNYTAAWCSGEAAAVAAFYEENGSLQINGGATSVGRTGIRDAAQDFMTTFPDMVVAMDVATKHRHLNPTSPAVIHRRSEQSGQAQRVLVGKRDGRRGKGRCEVTYGSRPDDRRVHTRLVKHPRESQRAHVDVRSARFVRRTRPDRERRASEIRCRYGSGRSVIRDPAG